MEGLADLDELVLRCRSGNARRYIAEAVGCYRAGAQRSAIVATWIAVVYDFIDKLRELELAGDAKARSLIEDIDKMHETRDLQGSLAFERKVLDAAQKDFELISQQEHADLSRLFEDRNRCAHPSLNADSEEYQPTPELSRYHIANAVLHLLQHQPAQGKAALAKVLNDISSSLFPVKKEDAVTQLGYGPLGRARDSLVKNLIVTLLKKLVLDPTLTPPSAERIGVAILAVREMHLDISEGLLTNKTSEICRRAVDEGRSQAVVGALRVAPALWDYFNDEVRSLVRRYLEEDNLPSEVPAIAISIPSIRGFILPRISQMGPKTLANLIREVGPLQEFLERALDLYERSENFEQANFRATNLIVPLAGLLGEKHFRRIATEIAVNYQVRNSFEVGVALNAIKAAGVISAETISAVLLESDLGDQFPAFVIRPVQGDPLASNS